MTEREKVKLLERFTQAWNAHDVNALMDCMTADCIFLSATGTSEEGMRYEGFEAVKLAYAQVFEKFPNGAWKDSEHSADGDVGISEWLFEGTASDGNGLPTSVRGVDLFRFKDGKIFIKDTFRKQVI